MIEELTGLCAKDEKQTYQEFLVYLSDIISKYPDFALVYYHTVQCITRNIPIQQSLTECITSYTEYEDISNLEDNELSILQEKIITDLILKKAEMLDIS
jgi:hypothetical protein